MCGIIAYRGSEPAAPLLLEGLKRLEYRGYDSAGMAVFDGTLHTRKGVGKVIAVERQEHFSELKGTLGIAHTRWATSGGVTKENAHPHVADGLAIVHNGIVENSQELKRTLPGPFLSETDTEVILKLITRERKTASGLLPALRSVFRSLRGRNAFVLLDGNRLVAARRGSPLVIGIAPHGTFLASDVSPLLEHTREVLFVDDNEFVIVDDSLTVYDADTLRPVQKRPTRITWSVEQAQKGAYDHFMLKEIMEQKHTIKDALTQDDHEIMRIADMITNAYGTYIVGCGSAGKVGLAATYIFSSIAKHHLNFALGSEFPCLHDFLTESSLLLAISQSGETADTLDAIEVMQRKRGRIISVVNVLGSTIDRISHETVPVQAGPEIAVCSTKATTGQLAVMYLLAHACAGKYAEGKRLLEETAKKVAAMLSGGTGVTRRTRELAASLKEKDSTYIIGRGQNYPIAMEAAIKIQEVAYVHAEAFAAGELKHGPIALIEEGTPLIAFVPNDETREDMLSSILEVKARGGFIIGVAPEQNEAFDAWLPVPDLPVTSPIVNLIPIQLFAYFLAVERGNDVDQPRNLAKSVTVK